MPIKHTKERATITNKGDDFMYLYKKQKTIACIEHSKNIGNYLSLSTSIKSENKSGAAFKVQEWIKNFAVPTYTLSNFEAKKFIQLINKELSKDSEKVIIHDNKSIDYLIHFNTNLLLHLEILQSAKNKNIQIWIEGIIINEKIIKNDLIDFQKWILTMINKSKESSVPKIS